MGMTAAEKILARAAGASAVHPGDLIWVKVDVAVLNDKGGPRVVEPELRHLGAGIWDPDRLVIVNDHMVPAVDVKTAEVLAYNRRWVQRYGIKHFFDCEGISHQVLIESGHVLPGELHVGGDSHTCTVGALGAFASGVGHTDMVGVLITGETWIRVPESVRIEWHGALPKGVSAKDMALKVMGELGPGGTAYQVAEWAGPTVQALNVGERAVLANMAAELGAKTAFIEPDETVFAYLRERGRADFTPVYDDPDCSYAWVRRYDATTLEPMVACPPTVENVKPVSQVKGVCLDQAYAGSCVGAKFEDMAMIAQVLRGRRVAPHLRLMIAPSSKRCLQQAAAAGILNDLVAAGATILASGCQACSSGGAGSLAAGERAISTTNRNHPGRMGSPRAEVYLGSPYTLAASAVAGEIADPREFL